MKLNHKTTINTSARHGFSLIELMIVIVIIGILMAIVLPALSGVNRRAAVVEQSAEFSKIDTAIAQFASDMGVEPWSEIILTENAGPPALAPWDPTSKTKIRRIWPTFNFTQDIDFNGDLLITGDASGGGTITLTGSECLLFFLAGVLDRDANGDGSISAAELDPAAPVTHLGFSKNPVNPFSKTGANRQGPWFNFDVGRMKDVDAVYDGMPEYFATLGDASVPIHFASANNGQGYYTGVAIYVQSDGRTAWNKDGHQLISAGSDNELGFVPYPAPPTPANTRLQYANTDSVNGRSKEADNVTNFKQGSTLGD